MKFWVLVLILALDSSNAVAAVNNANNDYFQGFYNITTQWSTGYLERTIALAEVIIGALVGFYRENIMPTLIGFGLAVITSIAPSFVNGVLGAVI